MNFKPTKLKIVGIIIALALDFLFWLYYSKFTYACGIGKDCIGPISFNTAIISTALNPFSWLFLVIMYLVWSLIQKK
jgi:hypothetical protein